MVRKAKTRVARRRRAGVRHRLAGRRGFGECESPRCRCSTWRGLLRVWARLACDRSCDRWGCGSSGRWDWCVRLVRFARCLRPAPWAHTLTPDGGSGRAGDARAWGCVYRRVLRRVCRRVYFGPCVASCPRSAVSDCWIGRCVRVAKLFRLASTTGARRRHERGTKATRKSLGRGSTGHLEVRLPARMNVSEITNPCCLDRPTCRIPGWSEYAEAPHAEDRRQPVSRGGSAPSCAGRGEAPGWAGGFSFTPGRGCTRHPPLRGAAGCCGGRCRWLSPTGARGPGRGR